MSDKINYVDIELAITKLFNIRHHIIVPNCYIELGTSNDYECDLLIIKKSGYAVEVEIKMSLNDVKADLKKKHSHDNEKIKELYFALPESIYDKAIEFIPEKAGLIIIKNIKDKIFAFIKRSPIINKNSRKLTLEEQLRFARLGTMRIWNLKKKLLKD